MESIFVSKHMYNTSSYFLLHNMFTLWFSATLETCQIDNRNVLVECRNLYSNIFLWHIHFRHDWWEVQISEHMNYVSYPSQSPCHLVIQRKIIKYILIIFIFCWIWLIHCLKVSNRLTLFYWPHNDTATQL
jgi:hypothetical protein